MCYDPISWFQRARLIRNPSMFVLGLPGLGKSTLVRRVLIGLAGYGTIPLVLGDVRPDYVDLIEALGGDVISLGGARGYLNPLDNSEALEASERLTRAIADLEHDQALLHRAADPTTSAPLRSGPWAARPW